MYLVRLLATLIVFAPAAIASQTTYDVNSVEPGGLYFATDKPGRVVPAPTLKADVEMTISGPIVRTRVVQYFENTGNAWVEGIYTYPLPKGSAIDVLKMQVGDRVIEGEIKEKAEAKRTYEQAKNTGRRASLVVQHRPNIFSTRIANIGPGETIRVLIEYQDLIEPRDNLFELRFPMVVRPRYNPGIPLDDRQARAGWGFDTDEVPDGSAITPPLVNGAAAGHNPVSLSINLQPGFEIGTLGSPSHDVSVTREGRAATIHLTHGETPADQDFILRWTPKTSRVPQIGVFEEETAAGRHQLLMLMPSTGDTTDQKIPPRELMIVLDKSGSMGGQAIRHAKAAVRRAILRLKKGDTFNLIAFDNDAQALFDTSQPVTGRTIDAALDFIGNVEAGGGTEMSSALAKALQQNPDASNERLKQIIFVTDGAVGNETALMAQIKQNLGAARLFTVGIGSAPNSYFMTEAAHFGRGTFINIAMQDDVMTAMAGLFAKIEKPQITSLRISGLPVDANLVPGKLPDLYDGEPIVLALKGDMRTENLSVTGIRGGKPWSMSVPAAQGGDAAGVANLWARRKIQAVNRSYIGQHGTEAQQNRRAQILNLALGYHLVSDFTSLVAVEKQAARPVNDPLFKREVATNLPAGMDWAKRTRMTISKGLVDRWGGPAELQAVQPRATASPMLLYILTGFLLCLVSVTLLAWNRQVKAAEL